MLRGVGAGLSDGVESSELVEADEANTIGIDLLHHTGYLGGGCGSLAR